MVECAAPTTALMDLNHFCETTLPNLSDEVLWARWLDNPDYQFFCGELSSLVSQKFV